MPQAGQKYVLVMVGLPARGKSYTARKLARYLRWLGYPTRVFNAGELRRHKLGTGYSAAFFDPGNADGQRALEAMARESFGQLTDWLLREGRIGIFDATNTTRERREWIRKLCDGRGLEPVFVEVINDDPAAIEENIRANKLGSPDYEGTPLAEAVRDFRRRIAHYERAYVQVDDPEGSYLKLIDRHRKIVSHRIDGWIPARIVGFLTNLRITERPVLLTRHGESSFNQEGRIGGDPPLSPGGRGFAAELGAYLSRRFGGEGAEVWTSTMRRTVETAAPLDLPVREWRSLDEIDAGICDGLTYEEIRRRHPQEHAARTRDKLRYRYPRGESYQDVIQRLDRVIIELERQNSPVLVISHQAVMRALYAYFADVAAERIPHVPVPLHTLIELTPRAYDCIEERIALTADAA
ncbi:MAG: histidine phosphatase family protein [Proteobacteria bacterium]|nr:histidine phosphatase family protein [Pseudomonadota bacterium]